jgi:hypothetical protein
MRMLRARPAFLLVLPQAKLPCESLNSPVGQGECLACAKKKLDRQGEETLAAYA